VRRIRLQYLVASAAALALATAAAGSAAVPQAASGSKSHEVVFFSTQLAPIQEAEQVRNVILKGYPHRVDFVTAADEASFVNRVLAEVRSGRGRTDLIGALHGTYIGFAGQNAMLDLTDVRRQLAKAGIPKDLLDLGKVGTSRQHYIPWMQATFIMVANKKVLPLLPKGADRNRLTYGQLLQWAKNIRQRYGVGRFGLPAADSGLLHRFLQGYLVPAFSGGVVTTFRSAGAVSGWQYLKALWQHTHPQSLTYGFMQDPLLSEEVLLAWDHVARVKNALVTRPQDFVAFPAPKGPKGRAYMPVLAGLGVPRSAPSPASGKALLRHLLSLSSQARTLSSVGFFPVVSGKLSLKLGAGLLKEASAVKRTLNARDRLPTLLPVGLGAEAGNFNRVFRDTFTRIIVRNEDIRTVLNEQAAALQAIFDKTGAPCWKPDPVTRGACRVR
jgi:multiple sugar transport system substrate-binding protein